MPPPRHCAGLFRSPFRRPRSPLARDEITDMGRAGASSPSCTGELATEYGTMWLMTQLGAYMFPKRARRLIHAGILTDGSSAAANA